MKTNQILQGDCLVELKKLKENSVDTVITDPPYGIGFMGKEWDNFSPSAVEKMKESADGRAKERTDGRKAGHGVARDAGTYNQTVKGHIAFQEWFRPIFAELLRVTKPGGTLMCFGGTRTYHRVACACEEAGWQIRDTIMWLYGSGFPKATDISKQLDKNNGQVRDLHKFTKWMRTTGLTATELNNVTGTYMGSHYLTAKEQPAIPTVKLWGKIKELIKIEIPEWVNEMVDRIEAERKVVGKHEAPAKSIYGGDELNRDVDITESKTPEAKLWNGWKSHGLKPAYEPILVAVKPNEGTYANNALKWGVAGLNIDGGRIPTNPKVDDMLRKVDRKKRETKTWEEGSGFKNEANSLTGVREDGRFPANIILDEEAGQMLDEQSGELKLTGGFKDKGGASRFFYTAKASKAERNAGLEDMEKKQKVFNGQSDKSSKEMKDVEERFTTQPSANNHPTVKPLKLMEYLCTLTKTPTGGIVVDPFAGSFTTAVACINTDRDFICIDKEEEYVKIGRARIKKALVDKKDRDSHMIQQILI